MTAHEKIDIVNGILQGVAWAIIGLGIVLIILLLSGCAAKRPTRFHAGSIRYIAYRYDKCKDQHNGTFKCDGVIFDVTAIDIGPPQ